MIIQKFSVKLLTAVLLLKTAFVEAQQVELTQDQLKAIRGEYLGQAVTPLSTQETIDSAPKTWWDNPFIKKSIDVETQLSAKYHFVSKSLPQLGYWVEVKLLGSKLFVKKGLTKNPAYSGGIRVDFPTSLGPDGKTYRLFYIEGKENTGLLIGVSTVQYSDIRSVLLCPLDFVAQNSKNPNQERGLASQDFIIDAIEYLPSAHAQANFESGYNSGVAAIDFTHSSQINKALISSDLSDSINPAVDFDYVVNKSTITPTIFAEIKDQNAWVQLKARLENHLSNKLEQSSYSGIYTKQIDLNTELAVPIWGIAYNSKLSSCYLVNFINNVSSAAN